MAPETIVALLGVGGLSAVIGAVVTGLFSRRKLGAEATEIITKAASGVVENMQKDLDRQVTAREADAKQHLEQMEAMAAAHVKEREEWRRVLQLHVAWDAIAIAKVAELGVDLPPVPPLMPANRHVDEHGYPVH